MLFDIDIDVPSNTNKASVGVRAAIHKDDQITPHPCGYYLMDVPVDPHTGLCAVDYETMERLGFQKLDLLSNRVYDGIQSKEELHRLMNKEPKWDLFLKEEYVRHLPHLNKHLDVLRQVQPKSVDELADVVSLIRPGKINLFDQYLQNPKKVRSNLYRKPRNGKAYFKKSHAYAYAYMIIVSLNKIEEMSNIMEVE